jgi:hypothetical protein
VSSARIRLLAPVVLTIAWLLVGSSASSIDAQSGSPPVSALAPAPTPAAASTGSPAAGAIDTGDPRSDGQGPGLVGEPLLVLVGIVVIGVATVVSTVAIARLTGRA